MSCLQYLPLPLTRHIIMFLFAVMDTTCRWRRRRKHSLSPRRYAAPFYTPFVVGGFGDWQVRAFRYHDRAIILLLIADFFFIYL